MSCFNNVSSKKSTRWKHISVVIGCEEGLQDKNLQCIHVIFAICYTIVLNGLK